MIPRTKCGSHAINAYPVHRPNSLAVAGTDLSGVVAAVVITVVLGALLVLRSWPSVRTG
jgi:hypothetical protein